MSSLRSYFVHLERRIKGLLVRLIVHPVYTLDAKKQQTHNPALSASLVQKLRKSHRNTS